MDIKYIKVAVQKDKYDNVSKQIEEIAEVVAVDETVDDMIAEELQLTEQLRVERNKTVEIVQQLWFCLRERYTYNESQIHMRAFNEGKTTAKKVVVIEKDV